MICLWYLGLPKNELVLPGSEQPVERKASVATTGSISSRRRSKMSIKRESTNTASVTTAKTTLGHTATVEARDKAFEVCRYALICLIVRESVS